MKNFPVVTLVVLLFSGCGTTEVMRNLDDTYKVSAQYGSMNGSWDRASQDANQRALLYCEGMGKKLELIDERREGVWGVSPQRAEVKFKCISSIGEKNRGIAPQSREVKLRELKDLFEKGLLQKSQYDLLVEKVLAD